MRNVNKVILIGNLTRDPEMRQTPNGQNITTFGIATNREWMTQDGQKNKSTEFHDLVAWSKLAEICSKYLIKGKLIYVEGYLKTRSWDTEEGIKKFKTEIVVEDMIMLEKQNRSTAEGPQTESDISEPNRDEIKVPLAESGTAAEKGTEEAKVEPGAEEEKIKDEPKTEKEESPEPKEESSPPSIDINEDLKL